MTSIKVDLMQANVFFTDSQGNQRRGSIRYLWPQMGKVPGANIRTESETDETSVPHISSVPEASGFYWSLGSRSELEKDQ